MRSHHHLRFSIAWVALGLCVLQLCGSLGLTQAIHHLERSWQASEPAGTLIAYPAFGRPPKPFSSVVLDFDSEKETVIRDRDLAKVKQWPEVAGVWRVNLRSNMLGIQSGDHYTDIDLLEGPKDWFESSGAFAGIGATDVKGDTVYMPPSDAPSGAKPRPAWLTSGAPLRINQSIDLRRRSIESFKRLQQVVPNVRIPNPQGTRHPLVPQPISISPGWTQTRLMSVVITHRSVLEDSDLLSQGNTLLWVRLRPGLSPAERDTVRQRLLPIATSDPDFVLRVKDAATYFAAQDNRAALQRWTHAILWGGSLLGVAAALVICVLRWRAQQFEVALRRALGHTARTALLQSLNLQPMHAVVGLAALAGLSATWGWAGGLPTSSVLTALGASLLTLLASTAVHGLALAWHVRTPPYDALRED